MNTANRVPTDALAPVDPLQKQPRSDQEELAALLEDVRKKLVETGTRNRLIHVNRSAKRANVLNIVNGRTDAVFDILRVQHRKMRFLATKKDGDASPNDDAITLAKDTTAEAFDRGMLPLEALETAAPAKDTASRTAPDQTKSSDRFLKTPLTNDELQKRVHRLYRDARTAEEEQGVNTLYLALGFLTWFEDRNSSVVREAPLILLPVELVRNQRTSTYDIKCREDDIVTNLPLQERLRSDFGIDLPEIDDGETWGPKDYFACVADVVSGQERWCLNRDAIQVGFFSFSKLLMLRDLDPGNWTDGHLVENGLVKGLLRDGFEAEAPLFPADVRLDDYPELEPSKILHVVDADASQTKVIQEVRSGRNLVVQGPPGTGKSQTITNILATAVHDGKTVLFVAEKMAALSVVHNRMVKTGLKDTCLELHSKSANKKAFVQELAQTLNNDRTGAIALDKKVYIPCRLKELQDELNTFSNVLHTKVGGRDYSPFQAMSVLSDLIGRGVPPPAEQFLDARSNRADLNSLTEADLESLNHKIEELCAALKQVGNKDAHPFSGAQALDLQPTDLQRLERDVQTAVDRLQALQSELEHVKTETGIETEPTKSYTSAIRDAKALASVLERVQHAPDHTDEHLEILYEIGNNPRFDETVHTASDWQDTKRELSSNFTELAWEYPISALRPHIAKGTGSWFSRLFGKYRNASTELGLVLNGALPSNPHQRLTLLDRLVAAQKKRALFKEDETCVCTFRAARDPETTEGIPRGACIRWVQSPGIRI
ncbi:MAG: DUF4011 domain-containing protein [Rhodobacteraceae bacterium]|nr:DUF4011 domain-containing protein [Paracoccaceae bacterium]